jgi:hypothetical protein
LRIDLPTPRSGGVVGGGFCAQESVVAHVLLDRAVFVLAADDGIAKVMIGDLGFETTAIGFGDAVAEDGAELVGTADAAIEVQQALSHAVEGGALGEDQIGAVLDLAAEQPIDVDGSSTRVGGVERHQFVQPALDRAIQVTWGEAVSEQLEPFGVSTLDEGVGCLTEANPFTLELACQVLVLVDAHPRIERKVGADAQEHAAPLPVAQIEVVLPHETRADLDAIAAAGRRVADGDSRVLAALEDDHDPETPAESLIERLDPVLSTQTFGRLNDLHAVRRRQLTDEAVVVLRHLAELGPGNRRDVLALVEQADDQCRPLHRLNDRVEQHTIKARVLQPDAPAMVLDERVHGGPPHAWVPDYVPGHIIALLWPTGLCGRGYRPPLGVQCGRVNPAT